MWRLSKSSILNRMGVDQRLIVISDLALSISPIDFGIPKYGGMRTAVEQNYLFKSGFSKCDGYKRLSKHQSDSALDFYAFVDGKASWEPYHLAVVAAAHLQAAAIVGYGIQWGGLWKSFVDMPHVELI